MRVYASWSGWFYRQFSPNERMCSPNCFEFAFTTFTARANRGALVHVLIIRIRHLPVSHSRTAQSKRKQTSSRAHVSRGLRSNSRIKSRIKSCKLRIGGGQRRRRVRGFLILRAVARRRPRGRRTVALARQLSPRRRGRRWTRRRCRRRGGCLRRRRQRRRRRRA